MRRTDFVFNYRVRNWPEYNKALISRGSLTLWVDEQAVSNWRREAAPRGRGRPQVYTDTAIECALVVRAVFHLSLRATQGFLESVVRLMGADLQVPAYSTVCRRQASLELRVQTAAARHVVIDTTGLKVYGAGEWYVRKHGMEKSRRRTWRKLHLCVDEASRDIVAVDLTTSTVHDSAHLPGMLDLVEGDVGQVSADSAYDSAACYKAILERGAVPTIPPRRNAKFSSAKDPPATRAERDAVLRCIKKQGRYAWRTSSGATRQSLAENAVSLMVAAGSGDGADVETMRLLLGLGADSSVVSEAGSVARYAAAGLGWNYKPGGDASRLQLCLELGCDPNEVDLRGVTLLADAAATGDVSRGKVLRGVGASPNADRSAIPSAFPPIPESPFDEDAPFSFRIPLHNAVEVDQFEMVRVLLAAGADIHALDSSRRTALFQARSSRVARLLIDAGLDVDAPDCLGWSPLVSAVMEGERDAVTALIAVGADVNATHDHGFTVFMSAVSSSNRSLDIIDALVDAGADPLVRSEFGWNAFHAAIDVNGPDANSEESVRSTFSRIKDLGVDINREDAEGFRPLDWARHCGTELEIRVLLELGATP